MKIIANTVKEIQLIRIFSGENKYEIKILYLFNNAYCGALKIKRKPCCSNRVPIVKYYISTTVLRGFQRTDKKHNLIGSKVLRNLN